VSTGSPSGRPLSRVLSPATGAPETALIVLGRRADVLRDSAGGAGPLLPAPSALMPVSEPITLVVAHFEDLFARGLRVVIDGDPALEVLAGDIAPDRLDVVLRAHQPRAAILNVDAFDKLARVRELSRQHPDTRSVLIATQPTMTTCAQLLAFGASACLGRDAQARDVLTAIHLASRGLQLTPSYSGEPPALPVAGSQLLTQREAEILPMLQQGSSNAQIAWTLQVGVETIRTHARNIYRKLGVGSRRELATLPPHPLPDDRQDVQPHAPPVWATARTETHRRPGS
jgi:DNA-binding NarL/FixJ family response regulator